jgi:hypothetical protein
MSEKQNIMWVLVPIGGHTNNIFADMLAEMQRADTRIDTFDGPGYIVPSELLLDKKGEQKPSILIKKVESSVGKFNLDYYLYVKIGDRKPKKWKYSFTNKGKGHKVAKEAVKKMYAKINTCKQK